MIGVRIVGGYRFRNKIKVGIREVDKNLKERKVSDLKVGLKILGNKEEYLNQEVLRRFMEDIDKIEPLFIKHGEDTLTPYITNGSLDLYRVYYYGKNLYECFDCQDVAMECLEYVAYGYKEHQEFAMEVLRRYIDLRKNKSANLGYLKELINSDKIEEIRMMIK